METITLSVHLKGVGLGMLHHNAQLANPMNKFARELKVYTGKRKKTDDDLEMIARIEFLGSLWLNSKDEPCVPNHAIIAMIRDGLKQRKKGQAGLRGLQCFDHGNLLYQGPRKPEKLWEDERFRFQTMESVPGGKILRTRPIFNQWELKFVIHFYVDLLDRSDVECALQVVGDQIGIGDRRPTNGRFEVVSIVETAKAV